MDHKVPEVAVEPSGPIHVRYYGRTDVGLVRDHNEDNFIVADLTSSHRGLDDDEVQDVELGARGAILAVCDGMGGAAAGEVASQMAVDTLWEFFSHARAPKDRDQFARRLVLAIDEAGNRIFSAAKMDRNRRGMGTTATVAGLMDKVLFVGQVGDSRAYLFREDKLHLITKDQSLVNQLIEAGQLSEEEAEAFEHSNIILQALGTTEEVTVDLTFLELRRDDRLMMCSDGLSGLVHQEMIEDVMKNTSDSTEVCTKLIDMANAGGGHDNITVVCATFTGDGLIPASDKDQALYQQYPLPPGEDDDGDSFPPRQPRIKEGGPKPGADVKRGLDGHGDDAVAEPVKTFPWPLIITIMVLAIIAAAVVLLMDDGGSTAGVSPPTSITPEPETIALIPPVPVRVMTDIEGELWVDGEAFGSLAADEELVVDLVPGAYQFEARSGGDVVAEATLTVQQDTPTEVELTMPTGTSDMEPEGETEGEPEGEPEGQTATEAGAEEPPSEPPTTEEPATASPEAEPPGAEPAPATAPDPPAATPDTAPAAAAQAEGDESLAARRAARQQRLQRARQQRRRAAQSMMADEDPAVVPAAPPPSD